MKSIRCSLSRWFLFCSLATVPGSAAAITFTNDTLISFGDTNYDGQDIVVTNCTLTVDGAHGFQTITVQNGGRLTHSYSADGLLQGVLHILKEEHTLAPTNTVLNYTNVLAATVVVQDASGNTNYVASTDYQLTLLTDTGLTQLSLLPGSAIAEGATLLITFDVGLPPVNTGLFLTTPGPVAIEPGGSIDASARGFGPGYSIGIGGSRSTNYPVSYTAGSGAGHGGYGGGSSTLAPGGNSYGNFAAPDTKGSCGGRGSGNGGNGGGVIRLDVAGEVRVDGQLLCNGGNPTNSRAGGGAGGSIWILSQSITGSGIIEAVGGAGEPRDGGGGGGGRIALVSATNEFRGRISAQGGRGWVAGGAGTIYTSTATGTGTRSRLLIDNGGIAGTNTPIVAMTGMEISIDGKANAQLANSATLQSLGIGPGGTLTFAGGTITVLSNAIIDATGRIDATGKGYPANQGQGRGLYTSFPSGSAGGGGYGGMGGMGISIYGGATYGSLTQPIDRGSGGGAYSPVGGVGGGAIRLDVRGDLTLNGTIAADGAPAANTTIGLYAGGGGGSGGSVWLTAGKLSGSGFISANGGSGDLPGGGGGGGGRIALYATSNLFSGEIQARGGAGAGWGGAGTIYLGATGNQVARLIVDNGGHTGTNTPVSGFSLGSLQISGGAIASTPGSSGPLTSLFIGSNSWFLPGYSGVSYYLEVFHSAVIESGGGISVDGMGFGRGSGYGAGRAAGSFAGGGGYGGYGGNGATNSGGGNAYGSMTTPRDPGSGGGYTVSEPQPSNSGYGGGALLLNFREDLVLDGTISANGTPAGAARNGGGSGGTISATAARISGAGLFRANGGAGSGGGGGGGGGRIALFYRTNLFAGVVQCEGGVGATPGGAGTVYIQDDNQRSVTQLIVDNGGKLGTNTLLSSPTGQMDVVVRNGACASPSSYGYLTFRNLRIESNAAFVLGPISGYSSPWSIRVTRDATIQRGGRLLATLPSTLAGPGPGRYTSPFGGGGGGYGGSGGDAAGTTNTGGGSYGSFTEPNLIGSAGGGQSTTVKGGVGGGALLLYVDGTLTLDGLIAANGTAATGANCGGGSGGSLSLKPRTILGSGAIMADGGDGGLLNGGGGGGGRIALSFDSSQFAGTFSARGGRGVHVGGAGTIFVKRLSDPAGTLLVDNGGQLGGLTGLPSSPTPCHLSVYGGATAFPMPTYSAVSFIFQSLRVGADSGLTHLQNQPFLDITVLGDAAIEPRARIAVDAKGYNATSPGPGAGKGGIGTGGGGGGYGGAGGAGAGGALGGVTYGSAETPSDRGSCGGMIPPPVQNSSEGGGALRLRVGGALTVDGTISANGNAGWWEGSGGGSGGSIWLTAGEFRGAGAITANGGDGEPFEGGGGGGGRIAIYFRTNNFDGQATGTITADGGAGAYPGDPGTVYLSTNFPAPRVISQGVVDSMQPVSELYLTYSSPMSSQSLAGTEVKLVTPNEVLTPSSAFLLPGYTILRVSFPAQNTPGDYQLIVGPQIQDIFGVPSSISYTGAFTLRAPLILGQVTDPDGAPVPGVTLQPGDSLPPVVTDAAGAFSLPVLPGWSGSVTPVLAGRGFLPPVRNYLNVVADQPNQRFIAANPELLRVRGSLQDTNLNVTWFGISNVIYEAFYSTNLVDWESVRRNINGAGGELSLSFPTNDVPAAFISVRPTY